MNDHTEPVLVTGAAGFVGQHVVAELKQRGLPCVALRRGDCDLTDAAAVLAFGRGKRFAAIVHVAARIPGIGPDTIADMRRQNVQATENILGLTLLARQFLLVSTLDVYGEPRRLPITESTPTNPLTDYAITKFEAEQLVCARCPAAKPFCILRVSHVYGPGDRPIKLIPKVVESVKAGRAPEIFGDGSDLRDFIHVRDVARAIVTAVERQATGLFNVASGRSISVRDAVRTILNASGTKLEPVFKPRQKPRVDWRFDVTALRKALDFEPCEDFKGGIRELFVV